MSLQKESIEQFSSFFDRLYKVLHHESIGGSEPDVSVHSTPTVHLPPQDFRSRRAVTRKELERYYAKPGEAEWGC